VYLQRFTLWVPTRSSLPASVLLLVRVVWLLDALL